MTGRQARWGGTLLLVGFLAVSPSLGDEPGKATAAGEGAANSEPAKAKPVVDASAETIADVSKKSEAAEDSGSTRPPDARPTPDSAVAKEEFTHPLKWVVDFATSRSKYIRENVRDYTCRMVKRERIKGKLQPYQFASIKVRSEQRSEGKVVKPMAVFMQYLAPTTLKDRRVLYIDGANDGKVLVRKGGGFMRHLKVSVDPYGPSARRESKYPITGVAFDKFVDRLIERASLDMERDPKGENTQVTYFRNAKVGDRKCTHVRVLHPDTSHDMDFYIASLYVDDELQVPTRLVVYDWPEKEGEKPPLLEEYTYVKLRLNVGLSDDEFSEKILETAPSPKTASREKDAR